LNEFLRATFGFEIPPQFLSDPWTPVGDAEVQAYFNLPGMLILAALTVVLVLGIRQSALTNTFLVLVKVGVVLFVIVLGLAYIAPANWTSVPRQQRKSTDLADYLDRNPQFAARVPAGAVTSFTSGKELLKDHPELAAAVDPSEAQKIKRLPHEAQKWGMLSVLGVRNSLKSFDDRVRSDFFPFGFSGMMVGAALVFFAYIGFDSISTHAEEAVRPQRDVPIGILASLAICTVLYMLVAAVITGMEPYPQIDTEAAVAAAFRRRAEVEQSMLLRVSASLIATGALAGMTSVLLVTFLSQARIFLAMARDGLLPQSIFAAVHPRFRTPYRSTILMGVTMAILAGLLPIRMLEEMVNIGTLLAFILVCGAVLMLRITRPDVKRPFRCPAVYVVAPLGILVNLAMMLFLSIDTWYRLLIWLGVGLVLYFAYGMWNSSLRRRAATQGT
jgi:APA family basic amino acid/polyamine antiporter